VYADVKERDNILAHKDVVKKYMDESQTTDESLWFEPNEFEDADFPSGRCIGTREINRKCAFLDKQGRCILQVAATAEGMHKWALKPLFCVLFPIEISNGVIGFDDLLQDDQDCCSARSDFEVPLLQACKEELTHLLGSERYRRLQSLYEELKQTQSIVDSGKEDS